MGLESARLIEHDGPRAEAQFALAQALAQTGESAQARQVFEQALGTVRGIEDAEDRADAVVGSARTLACAQSSPNWAYLFPQLLGIARRIEHARQRDRALSALAQAVAQAGELESALESARPIEGAYLKAQVVSALTQGLAREENLPHRGVVFRQTLEFAGTIKGGTYSIESMSKLARVAATKGMPGVFSEFAESAELPEDVWPKVLHAWRQGLMEHETVPLSWLRASLRYHPFSSEIAEDGVRVLHLAHLKSENRETFDAIIRQCPQLGLNFLLHEN